MTAGVGIVFGGAADDVKRALCAELRERIQQHVGQRLPLKAVGHGGQVHRPVVKGHGAYTRACLDALNAAAIGHAAFRRGQQNGFCKFLYFFTDADKGTHWKTPFTLRSRQTAANSSQRQYAFGQACVLRRRIN